jgi:apolipoprotein N-acyltransferase
MNMDSQKTGKLWAPQWMTVLSGLLVVLAFPPWNLWLLIWVCLIPWLAVLKRCPTYREAVVQGFWLNYWMTLGGFYWVAYVLHEFGGLPWIISIIGFQLFCLFGQLQFPAFSFCFKWYETHKKKSSLFAFVYLAVFYAGLDWIIPKLFQDSMGHSLYLATHLRQVADLGGVALLTFLILGVNLSLWQVLEDWKVKKSIRISPQLGIALLLCSIAWGYGFQRTQQITHEVGKAPQSVQVAGIQANIGDFDKIAAERGLHGAARKVLETFVALSDQALNLNRRPDLIIWPETSYPSTFRNPHTTSEAELDYQVETYAQSRKVPLLFGGYDHENRKDFNSFFILTPEGKLQVYHKNILLLFGEYIPGAESFQLFRDWFPQVGNFGRGKGPEVLSVPLSNSKVNEVRVAPIICYEALFPNYVIDSANQGSQLILNITNDSWFGEWGEPQLHLALSTFRSIETRLPMIRTTNTGISALILPTGEITHATGIGVQKIMNVSVPLLSPIPTLIKKWGDWFGPCALILGILGLLNLCMVGQVSKL